MRRLNAFGAGLAGGALAPLAGVADYSLMADGAIRAPSNIGGAAFFLLVLSVTGFFAGVLLAALWNTAVDRQ